MDDLSVCRSVSRLVCRSVHCGKTADWIRMPFGIIGRTGPGMRQVVGFGDRSTGMGTFGANLERAIVTNGDFTAYTCVTEPQPSEGRGGACGGPRHCCIRWGSTTCKGKVRFWGFLFPIFTIGNVIGSPTVKCFRFVGYAKTWQHFRSTNVSMESYFAAVAKQNGGLFCTFSANQLADDYCDVLVWPDAYKRRNEWWTACKD